MMMMIGFLAMGATVPADGVMRIADDGFRDWGPALVHFRLDAERFPPGKLELIGPDGMAVPFQIGRDGDAGPQLSFVASLGKGQSLTYTLRRADRDRSAENSTLTHATAGDSIEIGNEFFAVRLPKPVPEVKPPISAWRRAGRAWSGGSRFSTSRRIEAYRIECIEEGPVTVAYRARYRFPPAGEYVWQIRVSGGVPVAEVTEEFDLGDITAGEDFLMLDIGAGWKPSEIGLVAGENATETPFEKIESLIDRKKGDRVIDRLSPGAAWGPKAGMELRALDDKGAIADAVSVCPIFPGSWRRSMNPSILHDPTRGITIAMPIGVRLAHWKDDLTDDESPFSTHEHDPDLPATYGRRVCALGFGHLDPVAIRKRIGTVGLDRYKDWILDWPADPRRVARAFFPLDLVERLKASIDRHPERAMLEKLFLFSGKREDAIASAERFLRTFQNPYFGEWNMLGLPGYYGALWMVQTADAEDALACPDLRAETRARIRRMLAFYAYLYSEPDRDLRGSGTHLGNPNMAVGRGGAVGFAAALIPDHPLYRYWMEDWREFVRFKLASLCEPGGAWFEPPIYQFYGPTRALSMAQLVLRNTGFGDLAAEGWHGRTLEYLANLTMADSRYKGFRILPGMGNSGNTLEGIFGIGVGIVAPSDPKLAGFLRWIHARASGNGHVIYGGFDQIAYAATYWPDVAEDPHPLATTFIPGYGVAFRAHGGTPAETAMLLRAGTCKSHWDMDDLNVILYARGAPLSPGTGYQYYSGPATQGDAIYHNRVQVGKIDARQIHGRVDNTIQDYGFGPSADYAVARLAYPPEYFEDGKGGMEWRRHALFLKSPSPDGPSYFVLRDTFPGGARRPTWWHWLNLEGPDRIRQERNVIEMATDYGVSTYFWFADQDLAAGKVAITFDAQMGPNYHHRAIGKALGVPDQDTKEKKTIYQIAGKPGADYHYMVYPRRDGEAPPRCERVAEGCLKIVTSESTDYAFSADEPIAFDRDGVVFRGKAGAVRIFADRVSLSLASGSGEVGYRGYILSGHGPFERIVPLGEARPGEHPLEGGYEKPIVEVDAGGGITVTGEAPFTAKLDGREIRINTSGRARILHVSKPDWLHMPQFLVDGREWMACWTDAGGSDGGRFSRSRLIAVTAPEGEHDLVIRERVWLRGWDRTFVPLIAPAEKKPVAVFECRERMGLDWPRTLVTYEIERPAGAVRLVDARGTEHPFQISRGRRVSFFASLEKGGNYRFELVPAEPTPIRSKTLIRRGADNMEIDNGLVALRLLPIGEHRYEPPIAFADAPGPIRGIRLIDGRWIGGSAFRGADPANTPAVTGYTCRVVEEGPLFVEAEVRYTFAGGGWYALTGRVISDDPSIRIDEQFDLKTTGGPFDRTISISLGKGWKPDAAYWFTPQGRLKGGDVAFLGRAGDAGFTSRFADSPAIGSARILYDRGESKLFDVAVRYPWHPNAHFFGLVDSTALTKERVQSRDIPFLGIVPLHAGNWRGSATESDGMLVARGPDDVTLDWRFQASPHPNSLLHTGEYDPDLPFTFCRRQWALAGGSFRHYDDLWDIRARDGFISLDDYKDWILEWRPDPSLTYPRIFPRVEVSDARRKDLLDRLTSRNEWSGPLGQAVQVVTRGDPPEFPWCTQYRQTQMAGWLGDMEELLSSKRLSEGERCELRAHLAALCHALTEPDANPRGSMTHLGNPNMPINRFCALAFAASLIPDHPMAREWLDTAAAYLRYKLAMNTAPGGAWSELITYFPASAPHLMQMAMVLRQTGRLDDATARLAASPALFTLLLLSPRDPRFGTRTLPNWGHEGATTATHWLVAAALMRSVDPDLAKAFVWAWDQLGRPVQDHHDAGFTPRLLPLRDLLADLPPGNAPPQLRSVWLPGFGAVLRTHAADPDETYLSFRQGYLTSHCDANQGDFILYARGAPLVALSLFGYAIHGDSPFAEMNAEFGWHSRVRFGKAAETGGWPGGGAYGGVSSYSFREDADRIRAWGDYGPQRWTREISFAKGKSAKGPKIFVIRDRFESIDGNPGKLEPTWWYLRTPGERSRIQASADGFVYRSPWGPRLDVRFLRPSRVAIESRDATQRGPMYYASARNWLRAGSPVVSKASEDIITVEETITVTAVGPIAPGEDIVAVLTALGDGEERITTPPEIDYAFANEPPGVCEFTFHNDRIEGRSDGPGRFAYVDAPAGLDRLPMLVLDGQTYAPGTWGRTLIVPLMPGEHRFEMRALEQPPIFRNWQAFPCY